MNKLFYFVIIKVVYYISMEKATKLQVNFYKKHGMKIIGNPRYISAKTSFDGTDYSLITLENGVTISSNIRILTHDWAIDTVHQAFGECDPMERPVGRLLPIKIGAYSFIGTNIIIMPGCNIGKGVIIGAGSVVRGKIPDYSIVIGNPGRIIGDGILQKYIQKNWM